MAISRKVPALPVKSLPSRLPAKIPTHLPMFRVSPPSPGQRRNRALPMPMIPLFHVRRGVRRAWEKNGIWQMRAASANPN